MSGSGESDLTGRWTGNYAYAGSLNPVAFTADVRDDDGLISGLIEEEGSAGTRHSSFSGQRSSERLSFVKIYDSHDEWLEPINYDGRIADEGHEISGHWTIREDKLTGPFVMTRPRAATQEQEADASVTV